MTLRIFTALTETTAATALLLILALLGSCRGEEALYKRAMAQAAAAFEEGRWQECGLWCRRAEEADPRRGEAPFLAGKTFFQQGKYQEGSRAFRRAREKAGAGGGFYPARLWLARSLRNSGETEAARGEIEALLKDYPGDPAALHLAARLAMSRGDYPRAVLCLEKALLTLRSGSTILIDLGTLYFQMGFDEEAKQMFQLGRLLGDKDVH